MTEEGGKAVKKAGYWVIKSRNPAAFSYSYF